MSLRFGTFRTAESRNLTRGWTPPRAARLGAACAVLCGLLSPAAARADVVLDWNAIAVAATTNPDPYRQVRILSITQLAVFEAVNAVTRKYEPYLGTIAAPPGTSADAAAIAASHTVLRNYLAPSVWPALDAARANSLAAIPDGTAKTRGIATGEAAAAAMILLRVNDGSGTPEFHMPPTLDPGEWQLTSSCPPVGGLFLHWRNVTPFGIRSVDRFLLDPPPALTSRRYTRDYIELTRVGSVDSTERPPDRAVVAQFWAVTTPAHALNMAARQISVAQGRSMTHSARALALINMAINDSLIASFDNKYHYNFWRPETAIRAGDSDGNRRTDPDPSYMPFIGTPCFPSYPSNHASGTYGGIEVLGRIYGTRHHALTLTHPAVPGVALQYSTLKAIGTDVDDARIFGGIHFRFDQEEGARLGGNVGGAVYRRNLQRDHRRPHDREEDCDDHDDHRR